MMNSSQDPPASSVIWKLGTHHVEIKTPSSAVIPTNELHGPGGAKRRILLPTRAVARRNARCVVRIVIQTNGAAKNATPIMKTNVRPRISERSDHPSEPSSLPFGLACEHGHQPRHRHSPVGNRDLFPRCQPPQQPRPPRLRTANIHFFFHILIVAQRVE